MPVGPNGAETRSTVRDRQWQTVVASMMDRTSHAFILRALLVLTTGPGMLVTRIFGALEPE